MRRVRCRALADEGLQLLAQDPLLFRIGREEHLGHPAVGELVFGGVVEENVLVEHVSDPICRRDGDGQIVPAVPGIEQPINTALMRAGEHDEHAARYARNNLVDQGRCAGKPEQRGDTGEN